MFIAAALIASVSFQEAATYRIVEIHREAVFAGKLGDRVHENIVVERDGQRFTIDVQGDYHTRCTRPSQRLHEGDQIHISRSISDHAKVERLQISRVRG